MLVNLVLKEFKNGAFFRKFRKRSFLSFGFGLLISAAFVALEILLFRMLNRKLTVFEGASDAFLSIFLFCVSIAHILYLASAVRKTLYSKEDAEIMISKPVSPALNILSKIVFIYLRNVAMNFIIAYPILLVYGLDTGANSRVMFLMFLYPILIAVFETGCGYLLSIPYQAIHRLLKRQFVVKTVLSLCIVIGLCFVYSEVLSAFLTLVRNNSIYAIFSEETIAGLQSVARYMVPTKFYLQVLGFDFMGLVYLLALSVAIFLIGTLLSSRFYLKAIREESEGRAKAKEKERKLTTPTKALIQKELHLFFKDSDSVFSFSSLLVAEPFLTVLVIQAMNTIFQTGMLSYITSYFPYFLPMIHVLFIALFATFVNTTSSFVLSREGARGIRICKTIPVSYKKQIMIKMTVPFVCSMSALIITVAVLMITSEVSIRDCLLSFLCSAVLIFLLEMLSVYNDLRSPSKEGEESNRSSLIALLSILIPLLFSCGMFLLSYLSLPLIGAFFILFAVLAVATAVGAVFFFRNVSKNFILLEVMK